MRQGKKNIEGVQQLASRLSEFSFVRDQLQTKLAKTENGEKREEIECAKENERIREGEKEIRETEERMRE